MLEVPSLRELGGLATKRRVQRLVGCLLRQKQGVLTEDWSLLLQEGVKYSNVSLRELLFLFRDCGSYRRDAEDHWEPAWPP